jgi:hypothetical protein
VLLIVLVTVPTTKSAFSIDVVAAAVVIPATFGTCSFPGEKIAVSVSGPFIVTVVVALFGLATFPIQLLNE